MSKNLRDSVLKKGFKVTFNPRGDGNCFFEAATYQMGQDGQKLKEATFKCLQINRFDVSTITGQFLLTGNLKEIKKFLVSAEN